MSDGGPLPRDLPSIDRLLSDEATGLLLERYPRAAVRDALRAATDAARQSLCRGEAVTGPLVASLIEAATRRLRASFRPGLRRVINATGVVLHTNLGRAVLPAEALDALTRAAAGYTSLELDLESGRRGRRAASLEPLLCELTGAEAACVVNNNAASVLLILETMARGREVVVSRSELIEIGGAFRLPEVLERSGAALREVGTTNRTYPADYARAIGERTALLLKSHSSNFRMVGFVREVTAAELAEVGRQAGIPTVMDLGSGALVDLSTLGLPYEPTVPECVRAGLDLVCFSGDKLLGGPQAGIIVGRREAVDRCSRNPLMRALRCDKMTLAALEATLLLYRDPERLLQAVPTLAMLGAPPSALEVRARALAARLADAVGEAVTVSVEQGHSLPGGGSLPGHELPTWLVTLRAADSEEAWAARLRGASTPVVVRAEEGRIVMDVRTLLPDEDELVVAACRETLA